MKEFSLRPLALGVALSMCGLAHAADGITHKISGYGTLGGTFTDTNEAEYAGSLNKFKGAKEQIDIGVDSRLGLQGVVNFDTQFSLTAQALAQRRQSKDFDIGLEWFYGQYSPLPGLELRLGRVMIPAFLLSDSLNVGYAQQWMRAPTEVYAQMLVNTLDGVQVSGRKAFGPLILSGQAATGKSTFTISPPGLGVLTIEANRVTSYNITAEYEDWTARIGQTKIAASGSGDEFTSAGLQYDNGSALVMAEATKRRHSTTMLNSHSWYVGAGWRFSKLTPMLTYAELTPKEELNFLLFEHKSIAASIRYDVATNTAFKFQVNRTDTVSPAFVNRTANIPSKATVVSFGLDFMF